MNQKSLLGTAVVAALLFGAQAASACAIAAWANQGLGTGVVGTDSGEAPIFSRYSGRCSLRVANSNGATGRYVQDETPTSETSYRLRFYYNTGNVTGTAPIFRALNQAGNVTIIQVAHDGTNNLLSFTANTGGAAQTVPVVDSKYYAVEIEWTAGTPGSMQARVTGNGVTAPVNIVGFPSLANSADRIETAQLGLINGSVTTAANAPVYFDEFDSRRTTSPGRLLRGDANNAGGVTPADATAVINEFNNGILGIGQPDCNESGSVTPADATCALNIFNNGP